MEQERDPEVMADLSTEEMPENETLNEEVTVETESTEQETAQQSKEFKAMHGAKKFFEEENKKLKSKLAKYESQKGSEDASPDDEFKPRVEFLLENRDLDADEYDHLATAALRNTGKISLDSLREAKEREKGYISYLRKQRSQKSKIPGSTSTSGSSKYQKSSAEISKMTSEELLAYDRLMMEQQNTGI